MYSLFFAKTGCGWAPARTPRVIISLEELREQISALSSRQEWEIFLSESHVAVPAMMLRNCSSIICELEGHRSHVLCQEHVSLSASPFKMQRPSVGHEQMIPSPPSLTELPLPTGRGGGLKCRQCQKVSPSHRTTPQGCRGCWMWKRSRKRGG